MGHPQLPLSLRFPPDQRFDAFVGAGDGGPALVAAIARGERDDWVLLAGPPGSGKSHLLIAACAEAEAHGRSTAYLPLRGLGGRLAAAVDGLEGAALLALDDLDAVLGERADEIALFDLHNRARAAGCSVLYAASATAAALPTTLPDLRSRLGQCTQLALAPLSEPGRREVLRQRAARRGLVLDDAALDLLFQRVGRDLGTLTALLDRIDRESLAAQRRITLPFLRGLLQDDRAR